MKILCIGAGAVGGAVASRLARAGLDLLVIDANAQHVALLNDPGLEVYGLDRGARTQLRAIAPDELDVSVVDLVLLAVRSHATEAALRPVIESDAHVVSLQNGLNEDTIAGVIGAGRTIGCVVGFGATWIEPGRISLDAKGDLTIGRLDASTDERLLRAQEVLHHAFPTKITDNIRGALWAKMLVNSMTVLGALGGMITGDLLVTRERRRVVAEIVAEGVLVATAEGVELPDVFGLVPPDLVRAHDRWLEVMDRVLGRVGEAYGAIKSVTWRDFELGRATEIDAVTGEIVRRGQRCAVPTPLSSAVYAMLREIEAGGRQPEAANLDLLMEAGRGLTSD